MPSQFYTQLTSYTLIRLTKHAFTILYTINQLYTYKTSETCLCDSVHISRKKQLYTYLACENSIVILIERKI